VPRKKKRKYGFPTIAEFIASLEALDNLPPPPPLIPEHGASLETVEQFVDTIFKQYIAEHLRGKPPLPPERHNVMVRGIAKVLMDALKLSISNPHAYYVDVILEQFMMAFGDTKIAMQSAFLFGYAYSECSRRKGSR
jgi:hypothetical protein